MTTSDASLQQVQLLRDRLRSNRQNVQQEVQHLRDQNQALQMRVGALEAEREDLNRRLRDSSPDGSPLAPAPEPLREGGPDLQVITLLKQRKQALLKIKKLEESLQNYRSGDLQAVVVDREHWQQSYEAELTTSQALREELARLQENLAALQQSGSTQVAVVTHLEDQTQSLQDELTRLQQLQQQHEKNLQEWQDRAAALEGQLTTEQSSSDVRTQADRDRQIELTNSLDSLRKDYQSLLDSQSQGDEAEQLKSQLKDLHDQLASVRQDRETQHRNIETKELEFVSLKNEYEQLRNQLYQVADREMIWASERELIEQARDEALTAWQDAQAELQERLIADLENQRSLDELRLQLSQQTNDYQALVVRLDEVTSQLGTSKREKEAIETRHATLLVESEALATERDRLLESQTELSTQITLLERAKDELTSRLDEAQSTLEAQMKQIAELEINLSSLSSAKETIEAQFAEARDLWQVERNDLHAEKAHLEESLTANIVRLQGDLAALSSEKTSIEVALAELEARYADVTSQRDNLSQALSETQEQLATAQAGNSELTQLSENLRAEEQRLTETLHSTEARYQGEVSDLKQALESAENRYQTEVETVLTVRRQLSELQTDRDALSQALTRTEASLTEKRTEADSLSEQLAASDRAGLELSAQLTKRESELADWQLRWQQADESLSEAEKQLTNANDDLKDLQAKRALMAADIARLQAQSDEQLTILDQRALSLSTAQEQITSLQSRWQELESAYQALEEEKLEQERSLHALLNEQAEQAGKLMEAKSDSRRLADEVADLDRQLLTWRHEKEGLNLIIEGLKREKEALLHQVKLPGPPDPNLPQVIQEDLIARLRKEQGQLKDQVIILEDKAKRAQLAKTQAESALKSAEDQVKELQKRLKDLPEHLHEADDVASEEVAENPKPFLARLKQSIAGPTKAEAAEPPIFVFGGNPAIVSRWEKELAVYLEEYKLRHRWFLDPQQMAKAGKPKGIIVLVDANAKKSLDQLRAIAKEHNVPFVEHTPSNLTQLKVTILDRLIRK